MKLALRFLGPLLAMFATYSLLTLAEHMWRLQTVAVGALVLIIGAASGWVLWFRRHRHSAIISSSGPSDR